MPAAGGTRKWQITTTGAGWPQWQADGSRLFVHEIGGKVITYDVEANGNSFRFGSPQEVMRLESPGGGGVHFAIHPAEGWPGVSTRDAKSPVIVLSTSDLRAVVDRLVAAGIEASEPHDHGFAWVSTFRDLDGNHVELLQAYGESDRESDSE